MALNLEELSFQVNTEKLKDAITELGNLKTAVTNLSATNTNLAASQEKVTKAQQKVSKAIDDSAKSTERKSVADEENNKILQRQKDILEFMSQGYSKGQSSVLAYAKAAGSLTTEIKELGGVLDSQRKLLGGEPFDKSLGAVKVLRNEIGALREAYRQAAGGIELTTKQAKDLYREKYRIIEQIKQENGSYDSLKIKLREVNKEYANLAKQRNTLSQNDSDVQTQRRINNLSRGLAPQVSDVAVSLYGGMSPMTVLMQQGLQVRDLIQSSGVEAKDLAATLKQTGADFVGTLGGTFKAIGSLGVGVLASLGQSVVDLTGKMFFLGTASEAVVSKLEKLGYTDFAASLKNLGAVMTGVLGAAIAVGVVQLVALAVALKEVIKQESELSKAVNLTGGAIALNTQEAVNLASAYAGTKGNIGAYTEAITEAAKAGNISSDSLQAITTSAIELEKVAGVAVKDTIKQFSELAKSPTEAAIKLAESTGLIKPEVIAVVAELERQGDKANAAAIATRAYADSLLDATKVIKSDMSTWEIIFGSIGSSASSMWDKILNVGRKGDLNKQLEAATSDLEVRTREGKSWYQTDAAYKEELARLREIQESLKNHVQVQQDQVRLREQQRRATEAQVQVEQFLNKQKEEQEKLSTKQGTRQEAVSKAEEKLLKLRREGATITDQAIEQEKKLAGVRWDDSQKKTGTSGKSDAQKELEAYNKLVSDLSDQTSGLNANYSENFALIVKLAKTEEQRVEQITQLLMKQPIYQQGLKAEAEAHKQNQKSLDDLVDSILKVEKAKEKQEEQNKKLLGWSQEQTLSLAQESEQLAIQARMLGLTSEQREKELGLLKAKIRYEKELNSISSSKADDTTQAKARLEALARYEEAVKNVNSKLALDAAEKLLSEIKNIQSGIADAIVTGLFEGGKAGAKKLRDVITSELKRQITLQINANVKTSGTASVIHRAGSIAGNFASNYSTSGFGTALTSGLDEAGQWARDYWIETGNEVFQGIGETLGTWSSNVGEFSGVINDAVGYLGAFNTALDGDYGAAIGEGLGYYFGGPIGAAIGKEIGSWLGLTDDSGTIHTGGIASYNSVTGTQTSTTHGAFGTGFGGVDYSKQTTDVVSGIAKGVSQMLDATAETFGKTAGYSVATAFADDTSKDGAWGALVVKLGDSLVTSWEDSRVSKWAPKVFADGEAGAKEYALAVAQDVRNVLLEQTPDWADTMLKALGDAPTLESLTAVVSQINAVAIAFDSLGNTFADLTDESMSDFIKAMGGTSSAIQGLSSYYNEFYSAEQKAELTTKQLTEEFSKLGQELPRTRAEYKDLVEGALVSGNEQLAASLVKLSGGFASITEEVSKVSETLRRLESESKSLQRELLVSQNGNVRAFDTEGYTEAELAQYDYNAKLRKQIDTLKALNVLWSAADAAADKFLTGDKLKLFKLDRLAMQINEAIGSSLSGLQLDSSSVDQIKEAVMGFVSSNAAPEAKTAILQLGSSLIDLKQAAIDAAKASVDALWSAADAAADKFFTGDKLSTFKFDRLAMQINEAIGSSLSGLQLQSSSISEVQAAVLDFVSSNAAPEAKTAVLQLGASLIDMKQSALDAANAITTARIEQRSGLQRQLLDMQGDTAAIRALELATIEPSNQALQQHIWALQDLKKANDEAAEAARVVAEAERSRADQQLGLQLKIANLNGDTAALRAHELSLLSGDLNKALQQHIWMLEDQKKANDEAAEAARATADAASKSLDDTYSALERSVEAEKALLQESISTKEEVINNLKSVFDLLSSEARKLYQEVDSTDVMLSADARKYIQSVAEGNEGFDDDKLQEAISSSMSGIDKTLYKTKSEADKDRLLLANDLDTAAERAGVRLTIEEENLVVLRGQYDALENVLEVAKNQINELRNIDVSVKDLLVVQQEFMKALLNSKEKTAVLSAVTTDSAANSVSNTPVTLSNDSSQMAAYATALDYYVQAGGVVDDSAKSMYWQAAGLTGLPSFATGGFHSGGLRLVGEEGPELEVTGPAKYYSANQTSSMLSGANNDRLADQLEMMRHELRANVQYTSKLAKQLERLTVPTDDGEALQVKSVV